MKLAIVKVDLVNILRLAMLSETRTFLSVSVVIYLVLFDIIIQLEGSNRSIVVAGDELNDVATYIRLYLYSRDSGHHSSEIVSGNLSSIINSSFSTRKSTKVLVHGWFDNVNGYFEPQLRKAYLEVQDVNVIAVDWSKFTLVARFVIVPVGKFLAQFVDWLVTEVGVSVGSIHVIGFSLGAQLCGLVGEHVTAGRLGRITGLDPVGPTFGAETSGRLDASDAQFVDIIHTCGGRFGYLNASGHVDFYPNSGTANQPGCTLDFSGDMPCFIMEAQSTQTRAWRTPQLRLTLSSQLNGVLTMFCSSANPASLVMGTTYCSIVIGVCSHIRSYRLFVESISGHKFLSRKCGSWQDFTSGFCNSNFPAVMGEYVDHNARGNFYLYTAGSYPYALSC